MNKKILIFIGLLIFAAEANSQDQWLNWQWLTGEWKGEGGGQPGQGEGAFSFRQGLDGHVMIRKSHAEYPASENRPAVQHEDLMVVYPENPKENLFRAVYFDNESHVINYSVLAEKNTITFTSEKSDENPLFRLTYKLLDNGKVNTRFEISQDGKSFMTYVEGISVKTIP